MDFCQYFQLVRKEEKESAGRAGDGCRAVAPFFWRSQVNRDGIKTRISFVSPVGCVPG
jgi:hypothetical protein